MRATLTVFVVCHQMLRQIRIPKMSFSTQTVRTLDSNNLSHRLCSDMVLRQQVNKPLACGLILIEK